MYLVPIIYFKRKLTSKLRCEEGSAIVEFVALALPLFLPIYIFLNHYGQISDTESALRTLAREMSRAVVISENDEIAYRVADEVFLKGGKELGLESQINQRDFSFTIQCRERPCISPNNQVQIRITSQTLNRTITAIEYVSPWA